MNTNNIHSREASTAHGVVSSSSYSELTGNRKYVGIVNRLANVSPVEVALCFIPQVGETFCTLLPHASYRQYQTEYKYSVTVNYYNEMGYFMYSRTYNGYSNGISYERIS
ncbi:MAG: hypothetical protein RR546_00815 [Erysipelotrichaceae bacterium]